MSLKNSTDTIGNRTRELPTCSAVPQPTAPPRTPYDLSVLGKLRMGSLNTVMAMESKRGKNTGPTLLPKNTLTFQIFYVRVKKKGKFRVC